MVVLFSSMYSERLGRDRYEMELEEPVELKKLLEHLEEVFPELKNQSGGGVADRYASHYLCIGHGRILRLGDIITDRDTIEIVPPIMGG
jgi:molybdopterin converting factor small subunit